jgi:hypothetical protein
MDKLKMILGVAKKYQFWILCGVMLCTSLACWWLASGRLAAQTQSRVTLIDADFKGVKIPQDSANEESNRLIEVKHKELKTKIEATWNDLYENQRKGPSFPPNCSAISSGSSLKTFLRSPQTNPIGPRSWMSRFESIIRGS